MKTFYLFKTTVVARGDETRPFLMSLVVLRRFYNKLERVVHARGEEENARRKEGAQENNLSAFLTQRS